MHDSLTLLACACFLKCFTDNLYVVCMSKCNPYSSHDVESLCVDHAYASTYSQRSASASVVEKVVQGTSDQAADFGDLTSAYIEAAQVVQADEVTAQHILDDDLPLQCIETDEQTSTCSSYLQTNTTFAK